MAAPNHAQSNNVEVAIKLLESTRKIPSSNPAYLQLLMLTVSTLHLAIGEVSSYPSFHNTFEYSGEPSGNPEQEDDGENEGEDGENEGEDGENEGEDGENEGEDGEDVEGTAEDTAEDTRQLVGRPRKKWYALVKRYQMHYDPIPDVPQFKVRPYIMTRLTQMLNGTVNVYEVESVWFNHQADGWNVVFTFEKSPLKYAFPIKKPSIDKQKWMKIGYLHIKESFQRLRD
jgi:hypothetical protein